MLDMTDTHVGIVQQIETTLAYGEKKLQEIDNQIQELIIMKKEMLSLKKKLLQRLEELHSETEAPPL